MVVLSSSRRKVAAVVDMAATPPLGCVYGQMLCSGFMKLRNGQKPRTEPQEPPEKPNRMYLNRCFKTATELNRTVTLMT